MRSYKDCLIEYLEERSSTELNLMWYNYFKSSIATTSKTNFQLIGNLPPVEQEVDFSFYADVLPNPSLISKFQLFSVDKVSQVYKNLINKLIDGEYLQAKNSFELSEADRIMHRDAVKYSEQDMDRTYAEALISNIEELAVSAPVVQQRKVATSIQERMEQLDVIGDFFEEEHYHLDIPKYKFKPIPVTGDYISLDFDSRLINTKTTQDNWTSKVSDASNSFFYSERESETMDELNSKASTSGVKIEGELMGYEKMEVTPDSWWNESLIQQVFEEDNKLNALFDYRAKAQVLENLSRKVSAFHTVKEFDVSLTLFNQFNEEELETLKSVSFSVFPFHFSKKLAHYKWVELDEKGNLIVRIKSKAPQTSIIGADLKIYKS